MSKVTLRDIAEEAGVAVNTVSRALNNKAEISPETRQRILAVARRLQYRPNLVAKGLAMGKTYTVGVVLPDNASPFYAEVIGGIQECAEKSGYSTILANTYGSHKQENEAVDVLLQRRVDAVILFLRDDAWLERYLDTNAVFVVAGVRELEEPVLGIGTDDQAGASLAVEHLIEQGRKRIAYLGAATDSPPARDRFAGYRSALQQAGLPVPAPIDLNRGLEAICMFAGDAPEILELDAAFVFNDHMAIVLLRGLSDRGVKVPDDIAVVGYDDIELARYTRPSLSTVAIPKREMGRRAVDLLVREIERRERGGQVKGMVTVDWLLDADPVNWGGRISGNRRTLLLPTELVIRESSSV